LGDEANYTFYCIQCKSEDNKHLHGFIPPPQPPPPTIPIPERINKIMGEWKDFIT